MKRITLALLLSLITLALAAPVYAAEDDFEPTAFSDRTIGDDISSNDASSCSVSTNNGCSCTGTTGCARQYGGQRALCWIDTQEPSLMWECEDDNDGGCTCRLWALGGEVAQPH